MMFGELRRMSDELSVNSNITPDMGGSYHTLNVGDHIIVMSFRDVKREGDMTGVVGIIILTSHGLFGTWADWVEKLSERVK